MQKNTLKHSIGNIKTLIEKRSKPQENEVNTGAASWLGELKTRIHKVKSAIKANSL